MRSGERAILALCLTTLLCISFGVALHSWAGVCIGLCMGLAFGLSDQKDDSNEPDEKRG